MNPTFHLNRVRLNKAGFDPGGRYWGTGEHLWHAWHPLWDEGDYTETFVRAPDRDAAKLAVSAQFPGCSFHR